MIEIRGANASRSLGVSAWRNSDFADQSPREDRRCGGTGRANRYGSKLAACVRTTNRASSPFVMGEDQDGGVDGTVIGEALLIPVFLEATRAAMKPASISCEFRLSSTTG